MSAAPRDLAGEATEMDAYRARLRADISADEADDDAEERERNATGVYDLDELSEDEWLEYEANQQAQYRAYHS